MDDELEAPESARLDKYENQQVLRPEMREAVKEIAVSSMQSVVRQEASLHIGPLPRPEDFAKYENILSGSADRILNMAEKEQLHRHGMDGEMASQSRLEIDNEHRIMTKGQIFAFIIVIITVLGSFGFIYLGKPIEGLITLSIAIITVIGSGVIGKRPNIGSKSKESGENEGDDSDEA